MSLDKTHLNGVMVLMSIVLGALVYHAHSTNSVFPSAEVTTFVVPAAGAPRAKKPRPPLLFVHGNSHGGYVFRELANKLASYGYESHCITMPKSKFKHMQDYTQGIRSYIQEHMSGRPVLLGHSQGGTEIQHYLLFRFTCMILNIYREKTK